MIGYHALCLDPSDTPYFAESESALNEALRRLSRYDPAGTPILFGAPPGASLPRGAIVFETEQLARPLWYAAPRGEVTWTFSARIAAELRRRGWARVVECPLGYIDTMSSIRRWSQPDIDVLFYGSLNARREAALAHLTSEGLSVRVVRGHFGMWRDLLIERAKVVLNVHFYEPTSALEVFRLAHLWANRATVVTESGAEDAALEELGRRCAVSVPQAEIAGACRRLLADASGREAVAERGQREFMKLDFVESVRRAIEATEAL